jgi:hypothetical protein
MILNIILLVTFQLISINLCLKTNQLCYLENKDCVANSKDCEIKCQSEYKYQCNKNYCTVNKQTCDQLNYLIVLTKSYSGLKIHETFKRSALYEINLQKYNSFVRNIENCDFKETNSYINEICMNKLNCFEKKQYLIGNGNLDVSKNRACPCKQNLNYSCAQFLCAPSKAACDQFLTSIKEKKVNMTDVKKCQIQNKINLLK